MGNHEREVGMGDVCFQPGDREAAGAAAGMAAVYGHAFNVGERVSFRPAGSEDAYEVGTVACVLVGWADGRRVVIVRVEGTGDLCLVPADAVLPF